MQELWVFSVSSAFKGQKIYSAILGLTLCILIWTTVIILQGNWEVYQIPDPLRRSRLWERSEYLLSAFQAFAKFEGVRKNRTSQKPPLYIITPTWPRPVQLPELTRLGYALKNVENIVWIVAEDAHEPTRQVLEFLQALGVTYKYLQAPMPHKYRKMKPSMWPKGVSNRNAAMQWLYQLSLDTGDKSGAFYFADDDNTYDIRLFEEIRYTQRVSMFPVGFLSNMFVSSPILDGAGNFKGFYDGWAGNRTFMVDMAGFAVNVEYFTEKAAKVMAEKRPLMAYKKGQEEETFLMNMEAKIEELEFMAENCTKIYVWHTKTVQPKFSSFTGIPKEVHQFTNLGPLNRYWCLYLGSFPCGFRWKSFQKHHNETEINLLK